MSVAAPVLVELCAGMAGLSLRLAGRNRLATYRGGKWKLARDIVALGGIKTPSRFVWAEANPHSRRFLSTFSDPEVSAGAVEVMSRWIEEGAEAMLARWRALAKAFKILDPLHCSDAEFCAAFFLWRQVEGARCMPAVHYLGIALGGGAVKDHDLKPRTWIVGKLRAAALSFSGMHAEIHEDAASVQPFQDAVVYLDPPYVGTAGYSALDLSRERVVELSLAWDRAGAQVIVSEGAPVEELVAQGWASTQIYTSSRFMPTIVRSEYLTSNQPFNDVTFDGW